MEVSGRMLLDKEEAIESKTFEVEVATALSLVGETESMLPNTERRVSIDELESAL